MVEVDLGWVVSEVHAAMGSMIGQRALAVSSEAPTRAVIMRAATCRTSSPW